MFTWFSTKQTLGYRQILLNSFENVWKPSCSNLRTLPDNKKQWKGLSSISAYGTDSTTVVRWSVKATSLKIRSQKRDLFNPIRTHKMWVSENVSHIKSACWLIGGFSYYTGVCSGTVFCCHRWWTPFPFWLTECTYQAWIFYISLQLIFHGFHLLGTAECSSSVKYSLFLRTLWHVQEQ